MRMRYGRVLGVLLIVLLVGAVGCQKKVQGPAAGYGPGGDASGAGGYGAGGMGLDDRFRENGIETEADKAEFMSRKDAFENQDVYFDYDSYVLTEPAKRILDEKVSFLKRFPRVKVTVEGHCDERGTTEYNLALGERRANSAKQYLANSGVTGGNLRSVSYGKERPIATGHDETSWAKNRRAHFDLTDF